MSIRRAAPADIPRLLEIKMALAYSSARTGGFLLGCDEAGYRQRLNHGRVWVHEAAGHILGFAITLGPHALRASPWWALRERVQWTAAAAVPETAVGYFDQLAALPGAGPRAAVALAFHAFADLCKDSDHVVTTTVTSPLVNLAAVPLIERVGGERVGRLSETYPDFGSLTSDVWLVSAETARTRLRAAGFLERWLRVAG
jgi:hypothetical protein